MPGKRSSVGRCNAIEFHTTRSGLSGPTPGGNNTGPHHAAAAHPEARDAAEDDERVSLSTLQTECCATDALSCATMLKSEPRPIPHLSRVLDGDAAERCVSGGGCSALGAPLLDRSPRGIGPTCRGGTCPHAPLFGSVPGSALALYMPELQLPPPSPDALPAMVRAAHPRAHAVTPVPRPNEPSAWCGSVCVLCAGNAGRGPRCGEFCKRGLPGAVRAIVRARLCLRSRLPGISPVVGVA
jgi:hypothetical protein